MSTIKEQKRQNRETLQSRKLREKRRSTSLGDKSHENKELSVEGDSVMHINRQQFFDQTGAMQALDDQLEKKEQVVNQKPQRRSGFAGQLTEED